MSIRVVSYNVLSSSLCSPDYYTLNNPKHLDPKNRFPKILEKLDKETEARSIIALQEISQKWTDQLVSYFMSKNYILVSRLYGSNFNGYMGVGIAVPLDQYSIVSLPMNVCCVALD